MSTTFFSMYDFTVPKDVPPLFGMYPEAYLETVLDFLVFLLKYVRV